MDPVSPPPAQGIQTDTLTLVLGGTRPVSGSRELLFLCLQGKHHLLHSTYKLPQTLHCPTGADAGRLPPQPRNPCPLPRITSSVLATLPTSEPGAVQWAGSSHQGLCCPLAPGLPSCVSRPL
ncbi:unnamed protein product [Rangifer tarandus platyrhynchus]|uniref:Uncharacterized protein n=1 Tax=Rangifer tarandus platyrhynchus TaxID=3082113 RepID=A0AC60A5J9_RANTA